MTLVSWVSHNETFEIRAAQLVDVEPIVSLVNAAYSDKDYGYYRVDEGKGDGSRTNAQDVAEKITTEHYTLFVCVKKGEPLHPLDRVVGTVYLNRNNAHQMKGEICMFAIQDSYRKRYQIGPHLLQVVERFAKGCKLAALALDVVDAIGAHHQQRLIHYYEENGFQFTGEKEHCMVFGFKQPVTLLKMQKVLAPSSVASS